MAEGVGITGGWAHRAECVSVINKRAVQIEGVVFERDERSPDTLVPT